MRKYLTDMLRTAVADAYDAMTSNRSYRAVMEQKLVYEQIETNAGKQFDPKIAAIMLEMIKNDVDYQMREVACESSGNSII